VLVGQTDGWPLLSQKVDGEDQQASQGKGHVEHQVEEQGEHLGGGVGQSVGYGLQRTQGGGAIRACTRVDGWLWSGRAIQDPKALSRQACNSPLEHGSV